MMVDDGHSRNGARAVPPADPSTPLFSFQAPVGTPYGLEVTSIEDFHAHHDDWPWNPPLPGRATFHYLILVTSGVLKHEVDYITRTISPGQWLWVRPGQTQCWHPPGNATGPFILFEPDVLRAESAGLLASVTARDAPAVLIPHPDDVQWAEHTAQQLLDEHRALGRRPLALHHALCLSLLEALLLRLANSPSIITPQPSTARRGPRDALYIRFVDAVELHFRELHRVEEYARLLGCSVRTLTRAAHDATRAGARQVIDERRILEARRLLGHGGWTARAVAVHLGFLDASGFGRYFYKHTGLTPATYAAQPPH